MKRLAILISAVFVTFGSAFTASAQGKFGPDSAQCLIYLSYYQEYYKQKNFDSALPNWRKAYAICPGTASQNMFIHGSTLLKREIDRNRRKNPEYAEALIDSLLTLQDQRLMFYPNLKGKSQKATILNNKGQYMINYRNADNRYLYDNLGAITAELGNETTSNILVNYLQSSINLYRDGELTADDVIRVYDIVTEDITTAVAKNEKEAEDDANAKAAIESLFADSKVASCDNLLAIFGPRYDADPENISLLQNIVKLMNSAEGCTSNDLYFRAVTSLHKNDPSYRSAYGLYMLNASRGNTHEAVHYLEEAIAYEESDDETDAQYYYTLANFAYSNGLRAKAAEAARKAVDLGYGYAGRAYMILGNLWASASCTDDVDKYARYWAATDYYVKARNADESLADNAAASIANVSRNYPEASEIFMYDLSAGQSYTVSCGGLTATTTVRVSK